MPNQLKNIEQLIETHPDSALHILQQVSPYKLSSVEDRALYGLLLYKALDKKRLPLKPDSLIDFSLNYFQQHPEGSRLAYCYLYKGRICSYSFQYEKAMRFYLRALDIAKSQNDNLLLGKINFNIATIYNIQRDFKLARKKYIMAFDYFNQMKSQPEAFYSFLEIGRTYHNAQNYRNAQHDYQKALAYASDSFQRGALLQEMAINYYDSKRYDSSLHYFRKAIHYPYIENNQAIRYYYLADLFLDLKQIDSAGYYAQNALRHQPDIRTQRECYRILTNVSYKKTDMNAVSGYMNKYVELGDSLRKIDAQTKGSVLETIHETTLEVSNTKQQRFYLAGFLLLCITLGCVIFLIARLRIKKEKLQQEKKHQQQKDRIRKEMVNKQRKALCHRMEEIKAKQATERKKVSTVIREEMDRQLYNQLLHLNDIEYFEREMDVLLNNLISKLKERYPAITHKERIWCCLHLLCVPTMDIFMLLNYKVDSLNKMKQRFAQKVNLTGVTKLDDFLNDLLFEE